MREIFSLNDSQWFVGAAPPQPFPAPNDFARVEGWLPAAVPGDVRLALRALDKIPDPFLGRNNAASQWVDAYDWWYRRAIALDLKENARAFLIFEGIDYASATYWDGKALGAHVGMFSRQTYEIPRAAAVNGTHLLAVRVSGGSQLPKPKLNRWERAWQTCAGKILPHPPQAREFPERYATLKCQMAYGWDFAPRLLTCGIWDKAYLVQTGAVFIRDIWAQGTPDGSVRATLDLDSTRASDLRVQFHVAPKNFDAPAQTFEFSFHLETSGARSFAFQIQEPRAWHPWDRGEPNLYTLTARVFCDRARSDTQTTAFGLRTIALAPNPGAPKNAAPWTFVLNEQPEFIRGANWVPADALPARVTRADYAALLQWARDANINLLRVWGGGLKEKRAFYELCDELGILVWQEFPLAGAGVDYFPRDPNYLALLRQEAAAIIRALRNHPSVVLWCGGNEFIPRLNRHVTQILRAAVTEHDGTRPFKLSSPSQNESHNWRVWHGYADLPAYEQDRALFFGEFGLQAVPHAETLARFLPDASLAAPDAEWVYHNAEIEKLRRYAFPRAAHDKPRAENNLLSEFIDASQEAQLRGLQIAIEFARRSKPRVSGCAFWQFNEPWYAICWSVLDYARTPKRAYHKIQELYNPTLALFVYPRRRYQPGETVRGELWLVNDTLRDLAATLTVWHNETETLRQDVVLTANCAHPVSALEITFARGANALRLELRGETVFATNEYDLNFFDHAPSAPLRGLLQRAAAWLRTRT